MGISCVLELSSRGELVQWRPQPFGEGRSALEERTLSISRQRVRGCRLQI
jgi:hypothetical protein